MIELNKEIELFWRWQKVGWFVWISITIANDSNNTKYDQTQCVDERWLESDSQQKTMHSVFHCWLSTFEVKNNASMKRCQHHLYAFRNTEYSTQIRRNQFSIIDSSYQFVVAVNIFFCHITLSVHNHCLIIQCEKSHSLRYDTNAQEFQNKIEHV